MKLIDIYRILTEYKAEPDANEYIDRGNAKEGLDAIKEYNKALQLKPDEDVAYCAYFNRAGAKHGLGCHRDAIKDLDKAIAVGMACMPTAFCTSAYEYRASINKELGRYKKAIRDYDAIIQLKPDDCAAYRDRGIAKAELGRYKEALDDFNKIVELNPDSMQAHINRGLAKYILGQREEAEEDFDQVIKLNPEDLELRIHIALAEYDIDEHRKKYANHRKWRNGLDDVLKKCYDSCKNVKNHVAVLFDDLVVFPAEVLLTFTGILPVLCWCIEEIIEWRDKWHKMHSLKKINLEETIHK